MNVSPERFPVLSVRALRKRFVVHTMGGRAVDALQGVDLDVHAGEHVALAGTSGAGKSTLLKCVYRTCRPDGGVIRLARADGSHLDLATASDQTVLDVRDSDMGYVGQFLQAEPRRSSLEIVTRAAMRRGADREAALDAAAAALGRLHVGEDLWRHHPAVLSGGERQRVNLAAGTVFPPRLLLLDEPVSALDPVNRAAVLAMIAALSGQGVAVLGVFHDLDAMRQVADRVIVLSNGRAQDEGAPDAVLHRDALREVAR